MDFNDLIIKSWSTKSNLINPTDAVLTWIKEKNEKINVNIKKISLNDSDNWFYDKEIGVIRNKTSSFFQIGGLQQVIDGKVVNEQPIIIQDEIGFLGIICKEISGILYFLMQSKIEPGNVNKVQISPTIQATKSNFTQKHGGNKPAYLDYFINADRHEIIVDQIQSEQSSRFYKKRNRNIIIRVEERIEVLPSHIWMTLGQIKELLKINNLVNMDTRTVISCIPFYQAKVDESIFEDKSLYMSIYNHEVVSWPNIYHNINNFKMFDDTVTNIVPLYSLKSWEMRGNEFISKDQADFKVIFCDIEIEGREVKKWSQPLFEAAGKAIFGLFTCEENGIMKFLVKIMPEIGNFDKVELGPSVQMEPTDSLNNKDEVVRLFLSEINLKNNIKYDVVLSEEGGRFYHEQNRNIIINIEKSIIQNLPYGYFWTDFKTLTQLVQTNNCLNIQLRNLLSLLEV
jgi:oxidase EvaA